MTFQVLIKIFSTKLYLYPNLLAVIVCCFFTSLSIAQEKQKVNYKHLTYLPKNYNTDASKYPLVIYLHGGSQKGNDLEKLKVYGLPYLDILEQADPGTAVVPTRAGRPKDYVCIKIVMEAETYI